MPLLQNEFSCRNLSYEKEFDLHENELTGETYIDIYGYARQVTLT